MAATAMPIERLTEREPFKLPLSFDEVTAELLTRILEPATPGLEVESAVIADINEGSGSRARVHLSYNEAGRSAGLPATMWLKSSFNMFQEVQQQVGGMIGEAIFYRFAPELSLRAPRAYYAGFDADRQGLVLLEDLAAAGATFFTAPTPLNRAQVKDALDQLARLHGAYWEASCTCVGEPLWPFLPNDGPMGKRIVEQRIPIVEQHLDQSHLAGTILPALKAEGCFSTTLTQLVDVISQPPHCLVHLDAHLGNTYADRDGRVGFVDWQLFRVGGWFQDVAYFMGGAMRTDDRRAWEADLLKYYLDRLSEHGGNPPKFDAAWELYAAAQLWGVYAWVVTDLEMQSRSTIRTFVERYMAAVADLGTLELLSQGSPSWST